jgi:hypothetical protein
MRFLRDKQAKVATAPDGQMSLTDPDARSMATSGRATGIVGYNMQLAVDTGHLLILAHDMSNEGHDRSLVVPLGLHAKEATQAVEITILADRGYFNGEQVLTCDGTGVSNGERRLTPLRSEIIIVHVLIQSGGNER